MLSKFYLVILLATVLGLLTLSSFAQSISSYTAVRSTNGNLATDKNGNALTAASFTGLATTGDDAASAVVNIGFNFTFGGQVFSQVSVNTNGYCRLGATAISSTNYELAQAGQALIAPFGMDLYVNGNTARILVGTAPNRCFCIRWNNVAIDYGDIFNDGSFQLRLYETTNQIEFVYGTAAAPMYHGSTTSAQSPYGARIGFSNGTGAGNIFTVVTPTTYQTPSSITSANVNNYPIGQITDLVPIGATASTLVKYLFTPGTPSCGTPSSLSSGSVTSNSATINWGAVTSATQYLWEIRTSGACGSGSPIQTGTTTSTSVALSGLSPGTTYTYCVRTNACGGPSASAFASSTFTTLSAPCSGTPSPGLTVLTAGTNPTCSSGSFTLGLQNPTGGTGVTYQWQSADDIGFTLGLTNLGITSTQTTSTTAAKYYRCIVTCSASSGTSTPLLVTLQGACTCAAYCIPSTSCSFPDIISNVSFLTINRSSSCDASTGGWSLYTSPNPTLPSSGSTSLSVTTDGDQEGVTVWIDWNQNGTFESSEIVLGPSYTGAIPATYTASVSVPVGAVPGSSRMRVRCGYLGGPTDPCAALSFGETEDYCITIPTPPCPTPTSLASGSVTSNSATISWSAVSGATQYSWEIRASGSCGGGSPIQSGTTSSTSVALSGLSPSTTYTYCVRTNACGGPTASSYSSSSFTTLVAACSGTPAPGSTLSSLSSVCATTSFTLSLQNPTGGTGVSYQWQSSPDNSSWSNVGPNASTYTLTQPSATWYRCVVSCSGNPGTSTSTQVTMSGSCTCAAYCIPTTDCTFPDIISNVSFSTINRSSTCDASSGGWSLYTSPNPSIQQLNSYPISVTTSGDVEGVTVWIDWNQNGTFETGEIVLGPSYLGTNPAVYSGSVTVPVTAVVGTTRMRVRCTYSGAPTDPCASATFGETEDYCVTVIPAPPCSGTPAPGLTLSNPGSVCNSSQSFTLSLQNTTTGTGVSYQWQSSSSNSGPWTNLGPNASTYTTTESVSTWYRCIVSCSGNPGTSTPVQVSFALTAACYCAAGSSNSAFIEYISNVTFNTINNNSAFGATPTGYQDFSSISTTVFQGVGYPISVSATSAITQDQVLVWIDFNHNGSFLDAGELVYDSGTPIVFSTNGGTINIPTNALTGQTFMRVRLNRANANSNTTPCGNSGRGEVEDYSINILPSQPCTNNPIGGSLTGVSPIQVNTSSGPFTVTGINGTVAGWEIASSIGGPYTDIGGAGFTSVNLTLGVTGTYYVRARVVTDPWCSPAYSNSFQVVVVTYFNDVCSGATALSCGSTVSGSTANATTDADCGGNNAPGVWYSITPTSLSAITLSLCGSSYDTYLSVYTGTCAGLSCLTSNDDFCGLQSQVSFTGNANQTYYILVSGFCDILFGTCNSGAFTLASTCVSLCTNPAITGTVTMGTNPPIPANQGCVGVALPTISEPVNNGVSFQWQVNINSSGFNNISGATSSTLSGYVPSSGAGTYVFRRMTSSSDGGCAPVPSVTPLTVTVNSLPVVTTSPASANVCQNGNAVTLNGSPAGGTFAGAYVSGNTFIPVISVTPVGNNSYNYTYTDINGCINVATGNLNVYGLPTPNATNTTLAAPKCEGLSVALSASPSGTLSPYSMAWSGPGFNGGCLSSIPSNAGSPVIFSGSLGQSLPCISGAYTVTVTDGHSCSNTATTVLTVHANPTVQVTSSAAACEGASVTFQSTIDWHGETPASYTWYNPLGDAIGSGPSYTIASVSIDDAADLMDLYGYPGYDLSASNAAGCSNDFGFTLHVITAPVFDPQGDISVDNDLHNCSAVVNYAVSAASNEYWYSANGYGFGDEYSQPVPVNLSYSFSGSTSGNGSGDGSGSTFNVGTTDVTVTASNSCSNQNTNLDFNVAVNDAEAPIITHPAQNMIVECDGNGNIAEFNDWLITNWGDADASDNCTPFEILDTEPYWVNDFQSSHWVHTCGNSQYVDVAFRAHDRAGNYSLPTTARFTIVDTQPPVINSIPANTIVECASDLPAANINAVDASDICSGLTVTSSDVVSNQTCANRFTVTRTYTATDGCGNTSSMAQTIIVHDDIAPVFNGIPADITVECGELIPPSSLYSVISSTTDPSHGFELTAYDNCAGPLILSVTDVYPIEEQGNCPNDFTLHRLFRVQDICGNFTQQEQVIRVHDDIPPTFAALPAASIIECPATPVFEQAVATDNCVGDVTLSYVDQSTPLCGNSYRITRYWTAVDECGNTSHASQSISVEDHTAPAIDALPATSVIECPAAPVFAMATGSDACGSAITWTTNDVTTPLCGASYSITRTTTAADACGNASSASQTIRVEDHTAPVINALPATSVIECPAAPVFAVATGSDACGSAITWTTNDVTTPLCGASYSITRTTTATDACGNASSASQTIRVEDHTAPVINSIPANVTVSCSSDVPAANDAGVVAADACGSAITRSHSDVINAGSCANRYTITRTYRATDACGNFSVQAQIITVNDQTAPLIQTFPSNVTVSCSSDVPVANDALVTATDNCSGGVTISHAADVISSQTCTHRYTITRTYRATDICGNYSERSQTITVNDQIAPVISSVPASVTVSCAEQVPPFNDGAVVATDNCSGPVTISHIADVISNQTCQNRYTITRTYKATDACGNFSTRTQTITVNDVTPPVLSPCPANIILTTCGNGIATWTAPTAADGCGGTVTVTRTGPASGSTFAVGSTTTITYTATDACGNSTNCSFTVTRRAVLTLNAGIDEATYYGYSADQAFTHTLTGVSGGTLPYNYSWTFTRMTGSPLTPMPASTGALRCNNINSTGDEIFNVIGTPLTYGNAYWTCSGVSTANYIAPAYPLVSGPNATSVNLMLLDTAKVICTITDADGCQATDDFLVYAEDARCWAGNSTIQKVTICHRSNNSCATICVDESAVSAHLAHGDVLGACRNSTSCITGRPEDGSGIQTASYLTAYPNPFSNSTTIAFSVPKDGRAVIRVFDAVGNEVGVLFDGMVKSGEMNKVDFDGSKYAEGMYFYSITSDDMNQTKKMQLIK